MSCCGGNKNKFVKSSFSYKVKEAALTFANVVVHAANTGEILAEKSVIEKRISICNVCTYKSGIRCQLCGCFLTPKAGLKASSCPIKKW